MSASYKLPEFVIAKLYGNNLVSIGSEPAKKAEIPVENVVKTDGPTFSYLGDNEQKITIISASENHAYLDEKNLEFLTKVLSACNLSLRDVAIINLSRTSFSGLEILKKTNASKAIVFIPQPNVLGLDGNVSLYHKISIDHVDCIFANELEVIEADKKLKIDLWNTLKTFF